MDGAPHGGALTPEAFEALVRQMTEEIPDPYCEGVLAIDVSPRTVPHPSRAEVFTLGECIPVDGEGEDLRSRVVLYHGSFRAVSTLDPDFDWRFEAWETLTHELRHHLEWRAHADRLERYDWAAEQNYARQEGDPFDPVFFRAGETVGDDMFQVDQDVFVDQVVRRPPPTATFTWRSRVWAVEVPPGTLPLFLAVDRLPVPPAGDVIVVLRTAGGIRDLFRRPAPPRHARAVARRAVRD